MNLRRLLGTLALTGLLTSGCTGDTPSAGPTDDSGASSTPSGSATPSEPTVEPTVEPASGPLVETDNASVHAPEGWTQPGQDNRFDYQSYFAADGVNGVVLGDFATVSTADTEKLLMSVIAPSNRRRAEVDVSGTTSLGSAPAVHVSYQEGPFVDDYYGAQQEGAMVYVSFTQYEQVPKARRQRIIDSVLASFAWR